jgi:iron complex outermembrane receptor protein
VYTSSIGNWSIAAFIDNATDEKVATNKIFNGDIIGSTVVGSLAPPRTYGIELTLRN